LGTKESPVYFRRLLAHLTVDRALQRKHPFRLPLKSLLRVETFFLVTEQLLDQKF
jgi:hypothetical protein